MLVFSGDTTWTIPAGITSVKFLLVGGGAAGRADGGGGGGGGGGLESTGTTVVPGTVANVDVGAGGSGDTQTNGSDTNLDIDGTAGSEWIAKGGSIGTGWAYTNSIWAEGGVGGATATQTGATNSTGGKGGSGPSGDAHTGPANTGLGDGFTSSITGTTYYYGGGGSGGIGAHASGTNFDATYGGALGGKGGGGAGAKQLSTTDKASSTSISIGYRIDGTNQSSPLTLVAKCNNNSSYPHSTRGWPGLNGYGGGGGGGVAYGDGCSNGLTANDDGERTAGGSGGNGVVIVRFTVATLTTPSTPDLDAASDSGVSSTDNTTSDTTPTFSGTSTPGSTIQLKVGTAGSESVTGSCTTNSSGGWSCTAGAQTHGSKRFIVTSTYFGTTTTSGALSIYVRTQTGTFDPTIDTGFSSSLSAGETTQIRFGAGTQLYGFDVGDITVTGGTLSNFRETVPNTTWLITFTPTANSTGTAQISLDANKVTDPAGVSNLASATLSITYNTHPACVPSSSTSGGYTILTFTSTSTCNWNVPSGVSSADVLVVGGGGGGAGTYSTGVGASGGAGGGGGAYLANAVPLTPSAKMQIKVGSGGTGGITTSSRPGSEGSQGGDSAFGTLTAGGGGGGGCGTTSSNNVVCTNSSMAGRSGTAGGSGGGATPPWNAFNWGAAGTGSSVTIGGTTFAAQTGYIGAIYSASANSNAGGAGSGGGARSAATTSAVGSGLSTDIAGGSAVEYGRGGRGSNQSGTTFNATTSGYGNGGDGAVVASGAGAAGATGAQGVVIVKYLNAPSISLSTSTISSTLGSAVTSYTITNSGGAASSYSISPAFSLAGLSWSSSTGLISGTPTEVKSAVTYTITATNSSGTSTATFSLTSNYTACSPLSSNAGGYTILRFTTVGTCNWSVPSGIANADILVVGGGGAGGTRAGGGGGAGGYLYFPNQAVTANQSTTVTVGAGGLGVLTDSANPGGDSSFGALTVAKGGGGGGGAITAGDTARSGKTGGSGGGAAGNFAGNGSATVGSGTSGQGFSGGLSSVGSAWPGGGGGGSSSVGIAPVSNTATAGKGGSGTLNSITGSSVCYATGGGAGTLTGYTAGAAGDCGGAASPNGGAGTVGSTTPAAPTANTGAGGGGSGWSTGADLVGGNGASGIVIVRYVNGDAAAAAITTQPTGAASGSVLATQPVIRIVDAAGNTVTSSTVSVVASIASGGGTLSGTTSVAAVNGVATFTNLVITGTSGDRTLTFTPTSLTAVTSSSLTITVGAAAKVAITVASVGTQRRTAFTTQPQITVQDASGNTITSSTAVVTATVSAGGTLVGTTTATASSGVATFTNLGVDGDIGTTYTITYTVSGLTVATATVTLTATSCDGSFTCQVGDIGPGGGRIFYVAPTFFTQASASGSMCKTNCKYLEAAPTSGTSAWGSTTDSQHIWSGNTNTAIGTTARGTAVGTGYANTLAIVGQSSTSSRAATSSRAYRGPNNLSDWFLPSRDEFNQMCKWQKGITGSDLTNLGTVCTGSAMNTGIGAAGFTNAWAYWTSTERDATNAQYQYMSNGGQGWDAKTWNFYVRPIRAFGPAPIVISEAAILGVTAPVAGATPVTTTTAGTGYTGTVTWSGSPTTFATGTTYTATITLTAAAGYTLTGVTENFFTVSGATTDTNPANSGVVTAVFPGTLGITTPSGLGLQGNYNSAFSLTISASGGAGSNTFTATGSLPTGITLSSAGVISGTPTVAGNFSLTVTVTDANSATATTSSFTIAIAKGTSTVSLTIPSFTYTGSAQGPDSVTKTGSTGNVTYAYAGRGSTTYASSINKPTNVGTYTVTATVAADDNFASVSTSGNFEISKANQGAISLPVLSATSKTFPYSQTSLTVNSVTGGSGTGAVSISSVADGTATGCSLSGSTLSATSSGTCTLTVTKAADSNFNAATTTATFTFNQATQTVAITSTAPTAAKVAGSTYALTATGGASGNSVTFTSTTTSVCTVATATVSFVAVGTCSIAANQASTTNYSAATEATQSFSVGKGDPALSSFANVTKVIGDSAFTLTAPTVANSLPGAFTYASGTVGTVTISTATVTIVAAGTSVITATFTPSDSTNYNTATITMTLTVNRLYSISYDGNQSDGGSTPAASASIAADTTVTVASNSSGFTRTGHTFVAWNTAADGSGTQYIASNTFTMPSADRTLYAQWTRIKTTGLVVNLDTTNPQSLAPDPSTSKTWVNALPGSSVSSQTGSGVTRTTSNGLTTLNFDGNTDYFQYTNVADTRISGAMTVEMWINPSSLTNGWNILATRWFTNAGAAADQDWHFAIYPSGGSFKLNLYTTGKSNVFGDYAFTTNKWYLVGFTINSSGSLQFYVNGQTDGSAITGATHSPGANNNNQLWIGEGRANTGGFIGGISKFRLYSNALTSAEMLANYDAEYSTYSQQKITFNSNYGATPTTSVQYLYKSTSTALTANSFTRTGYTFAGWNTEAIGSGTPYANSASITLTNDTNLFAQWTANSQTITYAAGTGGSGSGPTTPTAVTYGGTFTTPANTFTRTGFTFAGWSDGTSVFQAGVTYPTTGSVSANVTLTATWTADTNVVVFDNNTGSGTMTSQNIVSGTATSLTSNTFTKTGYTFAGWNTNANGTSGTNYTNGQSVTITAGMTLYAKWSANALTVTYDSQGGTAVSNGSVNTGASISTAPTAPTKTGYTLTGWSTTTTGSVVTFPYTHGQTANFSLYAIWADIAAAVYFHADDYTAGSTTWTERIANAAGTTATGGMTKGTSPTSVVFAGKEATNSDRLTGSIGSTSGVSAVTVEMWIRLDNNGSTQNGSGSMLFSVEFANAGTGNYNIYHTLVANSALTLLPLNYMESTQVHTNRNGVT